MQLDREARPMNDLSVSPGLDEATIEALAGARHPNPFSVLGPHPVPGGRIIRAFLPDAKSVDVVAKGGGPLMSRLQATRSPDLFEGLVANLDPYLLRIEWPQSVQV